MWPTIVHGSKLIFLRSIALWVLCVATFAVLVTGRFERHCASGVLGSWGSFASDSFAYPEAALSTAIVGKNLPREPLHNADSKAALRSARHEDESQNRLQPLTRQPVVLQFFVIRERFLMPLIRAPPVVSSRILMAACALASAGRRNTLAAVPRSPMWLDFITAASIPEAGKFRAESSSNLTNRQ